MSRSLTKSEAILHVQEGLSFRNTDEGILSSLRWAQDQMETGQTLPWFLRVEDDELVGTLDDGSIALPDGFLREDEEAETWVTIGASGPLMPVKKRSWAEVREHRRYPERTDDNEGTPVIYALTNTTIEVSPVPAEAWVFTITYFKAADDLNSVDTNAWLENAPDIIWTLAGTYMAKKLRDTEAYGFFQPAFAAAEKLLKNEVAEREAANREYSMGRLV